MQSPWLPAIQAQLALDKKNPAAALTALQAAVPPIELGEIGFVVNISYLYPTYIRGEAYLAAGRGNAAAAEFQKIIDHSGIVWNCWTGALAHLGVARANALQAKTSQGADADAARTRALAAYKDFLTLWKDADPDIPILKQARAEYAKLNRSPRLRLFFFPLRPGKSGNRGSAAPQSRRSFYLSLVVLPVMLMMFVVRMTMVMPAILISHGRH
jgi:tetratricopeptide (TPR) repeat protein